MDLREIGWGSRVEPFGSGQGPVAGCCEYGDEPASSGATELVIGYGLFLSLFSSVFIYKE
jgi:hypothetical protein